MCDARGIILKQTDDFEERRMEVGDKENKASQRANRHIGIDHKTGRERRKRARAAEGRHSRSDGLDPASIIVVGVVPPRLAGASSAVNESTAQAKALVIATAIHKVRPNIGSCPSCPRSVQGPYSRYPISLPARSRQSWDYRQGSR